MTEKKKAKDEAKDGESGSQAAMAAAGTDSKTPCETLGEHEILVFEVAVGPSDKVEWRMHVCNTPGRAHLQLIDNQGHRAVLVDQAVPPPNPVTRTVMPPMPPAGRYALIWGLAPSGAKWQVVVEVLVNDTVVFRHLKTHESDQPFPRGFIFVTVL